MYKLKVGNRYKRIGTATDFATKTNEIVVINKITTTEKINFTREISTHYHNLVLGKKLFLKEFKPVRSKISFKGIV